MKKIFIVVIFLFIGKVMSQTINYFDNNPVWTISSISAEDTGTPTCITTKTFNYYINGDTLINSFIYKKIFRKGNSNSYWIGSYCPDCNCDYQYSFVDPVPYAYLRQEGKIIYQWKQADNNQFWSDKILYNFNYKIGDTFNFVPITIKFIDSIRIGNDFRKRYILNKYCDMGCCADTIIEGIGTNIDLFWYCGGEFGSAKLECFSLNDTSYYPTKGQSCEVVLNVKKYNIDLFENFTIFPIPSQGKINIVNKNSMIKISSIKIYNLNGQIISSFGSTSQIDISTFQQGIYCLEIETDKNQQIFKKIVKI